MGQYRLDRVKWLVLGVILAVGFLSVPRTLRASPSQSEPRFSVAAPEFDPRIPLTVVVRGWLWDPDSRKGTPDLVVFPSQLNGHLESRHSLSTEIVQWDWSRLPADVFAARKELGLYARSAGERAAEVGRCVNFVGHSAGAALVFSVAADGNRMGYMGTLGLPTLGRGKPSSVTRWANFYTTSHSEDVAGRAWAARMGADVNVDLQMPHRDFWESDEAARITADGIAAAWTECNP
ncbi:MAG: hypothetical protein KY429_09650 [Actinobacteria bacterium]|nr:hypothetical protein [Actinomycetota bacterium]